MSSFFSGQDTQDAETFAKDGEQAYKDVSSGQSTSQDATDAESAAKEGEQLVQSEKGNF